MAESFAAAALALARGRLGAEPGGGAELDWYSPTSPSKPPGVADGGSDHVSFCRAALDSPVGSDSLERLGRSARRVAVIVSDETRDEPRDELLDALLERLPRRAVRLVVAAGTHQSVGAPLAERHRDLPVHIHDGERGEDCVDCGTTAEGTRVRLSRQLVESELVVVTGRVRPHYFAGYSAGAKGIFPGCALKEDALRNHLLKADPTARLGRVEDNRCRLDMEAAARLLPVPVFALNVLADCDGVPVTAAAGDFVAAHRAIVRRAEPLFTVEAPRSPVVVVADRPPVSRSLYQASKMLPPAGALLEPGGVVVLVAECEEGIEPKQRVNEGIYRLGIAPQLPERHEVWLCSRLPRETVAESYAKPVSDLAAALVELRRRFRLERIPVLFRAGEMIARARSDELVAVGA